MIEKKGSKMDKMTIGHGNKLTFAMARKMVKNNALDCIVTRSKNILVKEFDNINRVWKWKLFWRPRLNKTFPLKRKNAILENAGFVV
jgi:hypothetical protein